MAGVDGWSWTEMEEREARVPVAGAGAGTRSFELDAFAGGVCAIELLEVEEDFSGGWRVVGASGGRKGKGEQGQEHEQEYDRSWAACAARTRAGQACEEVRDSAAAGEHEVRSDGGQGLEDEVSLVGTGVRDSQTGFVEGEAAIGDEVEVERARGPTGFMGAVAAAGSLDGVEVAEQVSRGERGVDDRGGVEIRTAGFEPGGGEGGGFDDRAACEEAGAGERV